MDFNPTEIQAMLADTVRGLVSDQYGFEARQKIVASGKGPAPEFWAQLAQLGLLGVEIDEAHGGSGGSFEDIATILQPLGRALVVDPVIPTVVLGAGLISRFGSEAQKADILPRVADGSLMLALAEEGDGREATNVHGGDAAGLFIVAVRAGDAVSLYLAPAASATVRPYPLYDGSNAADVSFGAFDESMLLVSDHGEALAWALDRGAAAVANEAVGAMDALCEITLDYLRQRTQFGKPIGSFQALQHRMVDMRIVLEQARSMAMLAAVAADYDDARERARAISAAKVAVGKACRTVGQGAVQLHGGIAITDEYSAGHYFKRLTMIERIFGDTAHHLDRFARLAA